MPDWSVGEDIGAGRLEELLLDGLRPQAQGGIYLLRAQPRASAKLRAFTSHLNQCIGDPPSWQLAMTRADTCAPVLDGAGRKPLAYATVK